MTFGQVIKWEEVDFKSRNNELVKAEKGTYYVAENRNDPQSRRLSISFIRFKSTSDNPGYPIVYLAGGPGGSGSGAASGNRFELFMKLRKIGDVIAYDYRGTGLSDDIPTCEGEPIEMDKAYSCKDYLNYLSDSYSRCLDFWMEKGVQVNSYNVLEVVDDLEDLKSALGVKKLNLWGISWGTHVAFAYVKKYEESVNRMILASLEGPNETIKDPGYTDQFLQSIDSIYQKQYLMEGSLINLMDSVFSMLDTAFIYTEIDGQKLTISKFDIQLITAFVLIKNPKETSLLPHFYQSILQGNHKMAGSYVFYLKQTIREIDLMSFMMDARSSISPELYHEYEPKFKRSILGYALNFPHPLLEKELNINDLGNDYWINPENIKVPSLFFSGTLDGRTYEQSARVLSRGFNQVAHIRVVNAGHDLYMTSDEIHNRMIQFLSGQKFSDMPIILEPLRFVD
jgi:pimeloyl-ACP methyl ester carboxylesterase